MKNYGEFDFIANIRRMFAELPKSDFEGIGDDCSVLPMGDEALVFTADMLNEGIHFLTERSTAYQIGYKSLMVNISDVAAMGAKPVATLLSLALPEERFGEWSDEFMRGYYEASARYNVALVGGDTTKSNYGVGINVTAIGRVAKANIKRRSAAKIGDVIAVTGRLGASAAGLRDVLNGVCNTENAKIHLMPEAQVREGEWFGAQCAVHAMMDVSDGIASDMRHILDESKVSAVIAENDIPVAEGATLEDALCGGEDYQLLLTIDERKAISLAKEFHDRFGKPLYIIGRVVESNNRWDKLCFEDANGVLHCSDIAGYSHF